MNQRQAHVYRGSFGAHMALLLRRFRRVSAPKLVKGRPDAPNSSKLWGRQAEALQFITFVYCLLGNYVQRPAPSYQKWFVGFCRLILGKQFYDPINGRARPGTSFESLWHWKKVELPNL